MNMSKHVAHPRIKIRLVIVIQDTKKRYRNRIAKDKQVFQRNPQDIDFFGVIYLLNDHVTEDWHERSYQHYYKTIQ